MDSASPVSFGPTATNWGTANGNPSTVQLLFNGFDSTLGPLQSVQLSLTETLTGTAQGTNTSSGTVITTFDIQNTGVVVNSSVGLNLHAVNAQASPSATIAPGATAGPFTLSGHDTVTQNIASNLVFFESPWALSASDTGLEALSGGGGNISATFTDSGKVSVTALYTYGTSVPEPDSLLLLGTGLVGLGMVMSRRRRMF